MFDFVQNEFKAPENKGEAQTPASSPEPEHKGEQFPSIQTGAKKSSHQDRISQEDHLAQISRGEREISHREKALALAETDPNCTTVSIALRHILLAENYALMGNKKLCAEHTKRANDYWHIALSRATKEADKVVRKRKYDQAIADYKNILQNMENELAALWPQASPQPTGNPFSSAIYERLANTLLAQSETSIEILAEASRHYRNASNALHQYNERFNQSIVSAKELQLTAASFEAQCRLLSTTEDVQNHEKHLLVAKSLLEQLISLEKKCFAFPDKAYNPGQNERLLIAVLLDIATFQSSRISNEVDRSGDDHNSDAQFARIFVADTLEIVVALQTRINAKKAERLSTLLDLTEQYLYTNDTKGLTVYLQAIRLAGHDKALISALQTPHNYSAFFAHSFAQIQLKPKPLKEVDISKGIGFLNFSKTVKQLAHEQLLRNELHLSAQNYDLSMIALKTALAHIDGRTLDLSSLANLLKLSEIFEPFKGEHSWHMLKHTGQQLCQAAYIYAKENFHDSDQRMQSLLTNISEFYRQTEQFEYATKILEHSRLLLQSRYMDRRQQMKAYMEISIQIADAQARSGKSADAVITSATLLKRLQTFYSGKDTIETLAALRLLSLNHQKYAQLLINSSNSPLESATLHKKDALSAKQQEIEMAKRLKFKDSDLKQLRDEYKIIQTILQ